jgi:hypothetical protein
MSSRTGFRITVAVLLLMSVSSWGLAQEAPQPADEQPTDEQPAGEQPAGEQPADETAEGEPPADETPADETPADETPGPRLPPGSGIVPATPTTGVKTDEGGVNPLSLRMLARRLDSIKATGDRLRARVDLLKDAVLEGGKSASTAITHINRMGGQFRLTRLVYTLDGTQVFSERDDDGSLYEKKTIDILSGPIAPGNHTIAVTMTYRGHGYGPFKYLNKQTFTVKGNETFKAVEGKSIKVDALAFERKNVPLEQQPAVSFKVSKPK